MHLRLAVMALALCGLAGSARAADLPALPLPILAQDPRPPASSPWSGLYVGTEIFGGAGKGVKGFVGGDVLAGYNHEFANNIVLGIEGSTGFAPYALLHSPLKGYDFATTGVKLGYDMGRFMPYVTADLVLAKANFGPSPSLGVGESASDLLSSSGKLEAAPRVGAGFDYALTSNLQVGLGFSVGRTPGLFLP